MCIYKCGTGMLIICYVYVHRTIYMATCKLHVLCIGTYSCKLCVCQSSAPLYLYTYTKQITNEEILYLCTYATTCTYMLQYMSKFGGDGGIVVLQRYNYSTVL